MARILYGIMGDARGHLSRSLSVVQQMEGHDYLFAGGGTILELRKQGHEVYELPMLSTLYKDTRVDVAATVANALRVLLGRKPVIRRLARVIEDFDPHLIISDYEFFTPLAARMLGRPCLSLDHQHVLTHCAYTPPAGQYINRMMTYFPIKHLYSNATRYLISSFFELPPKNPTSTEMLPPILRRDVLEQSPATGDHVLVYTSGGAYNALISYLEDFKRPCRIYGFGDIPDRGRIQFKANSMHGFLDDLATCRYAISNGGHNLISEALFYGKPVLCLPIHLLYEQLLNGYFLHESGFGECCLSPQEIPAMLKRLEANLDGYASKISQYNFWGNDHVASRLESLLRSD